MNARYTMGAVWPTSVVNDGFSRFRGFNWFGRVVIRAAGFVKCQLVQSMVEFVTCCCWLAAGTPPAAAPPPPALDDALEPPPMGRG